jgi:oligoendopeptidase F
MKPSHQTIIHFYQQLGKLFYSVASVDKTVRKEEIAQLNEIVKKEWVPIESTFNEFGDDAAYQIEIVFDWLVENDWNLGKIIPDFENFKKEHPSLFTPQVNDLILKTAKAITNSFSGKNKSESILIEKLRTVLYQEH